MNDSSSDDEVTEAGKLAVEILPTGRMALQLGVYLAAGAFLLWIIHTVDGPIRWWQVATAMAMGAAASSLIDVITLGWAFRLIVRRLERQKGKQK